MIIIEFLYFFLPVFIGLYVAVSVKQRSKIALLGTILLVSWINIWGLVPLFISVFSGYLFAIAINNNIEKKVKPKIYLILNILINLVLFLTFTYSAYDKADFLSGFFKTQLPIKLFCTFGIVSVVMHSISYTIDIYKQKYRCEHSFSLVAEYIGFFPVMTAGPFLRFDEMNEALHKPVISSKKMANGIKLFLFGLAEKLLLANSMYELWDNIRKIDTMSLSVPTAWIGMIAFSFSFYYEFAAYSNIARGFSSMMGFDVPVNFDKPFLADSIKNFFMRFNISVHSFFNEYIYDTLTKHKKKFGVSLVATMITVLVTSLWYGFGLRVLLWGAFIALVIYFETLLSKPLSALPYAIRCIGFNLIYLIGLPLLALPDTIKASGYIASMFGFNNASGDVLPLYLMKTSSLVLILCFLCATNISSFLAKKISSVNEHVLTIIEPMYEIALILLSTAFLISENSQLLEHLF